MPAHEQGVEPIAEREVAITRVFDAPARLLFKAFSTPEHLMRWFGPKGWPLTRCEMDFRAGGRYRFAMTGPDGTQGPPFGGEYLEIVPNRKIVYTNAFEMPDTESMVVTITFDEDEQMADDVAALAAELGLAQVDLLGYSLGGGVAWQVAIRHPQLVRRLVAISAPVKTEGWALEMRDATAGFRPETAEGWRETPLYTAYAAVAPRPEEWPELVTRVGTLVSSREGAYDWTEEVQDLSLPIQIIVGDADSVLLAPALELFQLLGGGVIGDFAPLPAVQLGIIPGTAHAAVLGRTDVLIPMVAPFLDAPMPEAG